MTKFSGISEFEVVQWFLDRIQKVQPFVYLVELENAES